MTRIAVCFALFLALVVVLADTRNLGPLSLAYDVPFGDKAGHFLLYGGLTFLAGLAALQAGEDRRAFAAVVASVLIISGIEELSQLLFPSRNPDVFDLLASYAGILVFAKLALKNAALRPSVRASTTSKPVGTSL